MKNTLGDLNNYLFEALERINDDGLTPEQFETELRRSKAVTGLAEAIIQNGELTLKAIKHADEWDKQLPEMLGGQKRLGGSK